MSRNPLIEAIHEARSDLETGAAHEQADFTMKLDNLVDETIGQSGATATRQRLQQ